MKKSTLLTIFLTLFLPASLAHSSETLANLPHSVTSHWQQARQLGEATFTRFGLHIYDASYWQLSLNTEQGHLSSATALSIQYARNISADKLLSSTYKQWQRLGFADHYPLESWLEQLRKIWPDVEPGDQLVFISANDGSNSFYSADKKLGSVKDSQFNTAFLDIWLSPDAKYKKHRKELLGEY